jgi:predicted dehydrogenase
MIKLGIAGLGFIGRVHLATARKSVLAKVVAVADRVPENISGGGSGSGNISVDGNTSLEGVATYQDADELLASPDVDAVILSLPTYLHKEFVLKAIKQRKHILVEKPLALSPEEGRDIVAALEGYDRVFLVGHCIRFWPAYVKAAELVREGVYGAVRYAHFTRNSPKPRWSWQNWLLNEPTGGGATLDLHIHDVDFVCGLFGRPTAIQAIGMREEGEGIGQVTALYTYPNGLSVTLDGGWCYPDTFPFRMAFRIACEGATLEFDSRWGMDLHVHTADKQKLQPELLPGDGYSQQLEYFLHCIERGERSTVVTPQSSLDALELVEQERKAMEIR